MRRRPPAQGAGDLPPELRPGPVDVSAFVRPGEPMPASYADKWFWPWWQVMEAQHRQQAARVAWCEARGRDWRVELRRWPGAAAQMQ